MNTGMSTPREKLFSPVGEEGFEEGSTYQNTRI
jgi:hypothetical protein